MKLVKLHHQNRMAIKWKLRSVMADRKMSVKNLAEAMGMNRVTVSNWKNADTMPVIDGDRLNAFCRLLNCTPTDLIEYFVDPDM